MKEDRDTGVMVFIGSVIWAVCLLLIGYQVKGIEERLTILEQSVQQTKAESK